MPAQQSPKISASTLTLWHDITVASLWWLRLLWECSQFAEQWPFDHFKSSLKSVLYFHSCRPGRSSSVAMALCCWVWGCGFDPSRGGCFLIRVEWENACLLRFICTLNKFRESKLIQNPSTMMCLIIISAFWHVKPPNFYLCGCGILPLSMRSEARFLPAEVTFWWGWNAKTLVPLALGAQYQEP